VPFAQRSKGARRSSSQRESSPSRNPARRDALGRRAAEGVPDSRSASERGESATARKAPANKAGVIWWSTDAEKRKRRRKSRKARAALERNEALVWERIFGRKSKTSRAGSCRAMLNIPRRQHTPPNAPTLCRPRAPPLLPPPPRPLSPLPLPCPLLPTQKISPEHEKTLDAKTQIA